LISNLLPGEKVLRYEADEGSLRSRPRPSIRAQTRIYDLAMQSYRSPLSSFYILKRAVRSPALE